MIEQFGQVLREMIRKDMNNYADDLATGACKSFEEYKQLCGVIQGLAYAEAHLLSLLEKARRSDDD
jgi:hypothetical protein